MKKKTVKQLLFHLARVEINEIINWIRHEWYIDGHLCGHYRFAVDKLNCQATCLVSPLARNKLL